MKDRPQDVDLIIPMIPEMELTATKTAEAIGEFMRLEPDQIDEIKFALIEACINAFEHSRSEEGRVNINFEIGTDALTIQISDRGQGFDLTQARGELEKRHEQGEGRRGWGLKIMEELMDEVEIESSGEGTTISLVKRRRQEKT